MSVDTPVKSLEAMRVNRSSLTPLWFLISGLSFSGSRDWHHKDDRGGWVLGDRHWEGDGGGLGSGDGHWEGEGGRLGSGDGH